MRSQVKHLILFVVIIALLSTLITKTACLRSTIFPLYTPTVLWQNNLCSSYNNNNDDNNDNNVDDKNI